MLNNSLFTLILIWLLVSISLEDFNKMLISNRNLILFSASGLLYLLIHGFLDEEINNLSQTINTLYIIITIFTSMILISLFSYKLSGVTTLGLGDIKLASFTVLWLGLDGVVSAMSISFILSSIYFLYNKIIKHIGVFHQYPFTPFISFGIFCTWIIAKI